MQMIGKFVFYGCSHGYDRGGAPGRQLCRVEPFLALLRRDLRSPDGGGHSIPAHAAHCAGRDVTSEQ